MIPAEFQKYIKSKEFKSLLSKYEQTLDSGSVYIDSDDLLDIAEYYHVKGKHDQALRAAEYTLEIFPDNDKAKVFVARSFILQGDIEKAVRISEELDGTDSIDGIYLKAELLLIEGKIDDADMFLRDEYEKQDDDLRYDMMLDIPMLYCDYNYFEVAEEWLSRIDDEEQKHDPDYIEAMARIYTNTQRYKEAIPLWNDCIDIDAFSTLAWLSLSQCQYMLGSCQEALESAEYAIALAPDMPEGYMAAGNSLFAIGRSSEAIERLDTFLSLCPEDVQGELLMASILFTEERYEEAREHIAVCIEALEREENNLIPDLVRQEVYRQAAFIHSALHDIEKAVCYVERLSLFGMAEVSTSMLKAALYLEMGQVKTAFNILNDMLQNGDYGCDVYVQIGMMLVDSNNYELGYNLLSSLLPQLRQSGYENMTGYDRLAYACLMLGHYDEFLDALAVSVEHLPVETVTIFSTYFPANIPLSEYCEYATSHRITPHHEQ